MVSCGKFCPPKAGDAEERVWRAAGRTNRGRQAWLTCLLATPLLVAILGPTTRPPAADAQNLSADDQAWIEQRLVEAAVYLGGGPESLQPDELPEFGELYRACLTTGLLEGSSRSATLDLCAQTLLTPLVGPQDWISDVDDIVESFLGQLTDE